MYLRTPDLRYQTVEINSEGVENELVTANI